MKVVYILIAQLFIMFGSYAGNEDSVLTNKKRVFEFVASPSVSSVIPRFFGYDQSSLYAFDVTPDYSFKSLIS